MALPEDERIEIPASDLTPEDLELPTEAEFATLDDLMDYKPKVSILYIPQLKKNVYIRAMDGAEVDRYRSSIIVGRGQNQTVNQKGMRAKLIILALGNADGTRMLTDKDGPAVQKWPAAVMERIFDRARKFNGLTEEDTDKDEGNS